MAARELNWDDLRYFLAAARAKSLTAAARVLGVDHSTIGRRLSALERALGGALVLRGSDGLQLTPLGERVLPQLERVERAVLGVGELVAQHDTRVRLAVPSGFARLFGPQLARLGERRPGLSVELMSGAQPVDLHKGEADLALRGGPIADPALIVRALGEVGWSLYAAESYLARHAAPVDPLALRGHSLIGYAENLASVPAAQWVDARASEATIVLRSREIADMVSAAVSGVGIAAIPCMLGDTEPGLCRLCDDVIATRRLSLVYRREARLSESVRAVALVVREVVAAHGDLIRGRR